MEIEPPLPTFLVCGAQKAGTTALYEALQAHPDVCMSRPKETEFFNWRYRRGWDWFRSHFDHYRGETAIGEASTRTMPSPEAPQRIAERLPDVKLIFVLRNPIERAHSAFWYYVSTGVLCPREDFGRFIRNEGHPLRQEIIHYGFYDRHLSRFVRTFDNKQCLPLRYGALQENPDGAFSELCKFIGVVPGGSSFSRGERSNVTQRPGSKMIYSVAKTLWTSIEQGAPSWMSDAKTALRQWGKRSMLQTGRPAIDEEDRSYLWQIYEPTVESLEDEIGLDLASWRPTE